jgi:hypothetical protein
MARKGDVRSSHRRHLIQGGIHFELRGLCATTRIHEAISWRPQFGRDKRHRFANIPSG